MDSLVEVSRENWQILRDIFQRRWPHGVQGYYALDTHIRYPELGSEYKFKVFCPYGGFEDGVIIVMDKGILKEVIIISVNEDTTKLKEALTSTKIINWKENIFMPNTSLDIVEMMRKMYSSLRLKEAINRYTVQYLLSKDSKPFENVICPCNTYTGPLNQHHLEQVDKIWPHRYATSVNFFQLLIKNGLSYGLFSTEDDSLLAWVFINEVGFLRHLHCVEKHRRNGFAEFLIKFLSNDQLSKGRDVFCYVVEGNFQSEKLFQKLNYQIVGAGIWMFVSSKSSEITSS